MVTLYCKIIIICWALIFVDCWFKCKLWR